jgi:hypothetical protein
MAKIAKYSYFSHFSYTAGDALSSMIEGCTTKNIFTSGEPSEFRWLQYASFY